MNRRKLMLLALAGVLLVAIAAGSMLKTGSDPARGHEEGKGRAMGASSAFLLLILVLGVSARRRRREKDDRRDG